MEPGSDHVVDIWLCGFRLIQVLVRALVVIAMIVVVVVTAAAAQ